MLATSEAAQLKQIEKALIEKYGEQLASDDICQQVAGAASELQGARIRTYVPVLVRREADERLRHLVSA